MGKLKDKLLISLALKTNCRRIATERKISGRKDFKIIESIIEL